MNRAYQDFVHILRQLYPSLALEKVIENIEDAVEAFGIEIKYSDMRHLNADESISGYAHVVNGCPEIVVNGLHGLKRQRFTIAHELGHILIHWGWRPGINLDIDLVEVTFRKELYSKNVISRERQANSFAAEFLAPTEEVRKLLEELEEDGKVDREYQISFIERYFNISNEAASIRWKETKGVLYNG